MRRRGWLSANRPLEVPPKCHVRKGDKVVVIAGKDRGKSGKVLSVFRLNCQVTVEKINIIKRHTKPNQQNRQGGILEREAPIHLSNVMLYCSTCQKPTRVGTTTLTDGSHVRVCRKCKQPIESSERS
ncbi:MAG TPA: 50S ribosomal protein L24 [Nitrospirales bacterium]|nr:50S ribosomal protein L24 [Nitrospirales bacterium]